MSKLIFICFALLAASAFAGHQFNQRFQCLGESSHLAPAVRKALDASGEDFLNAV